VPSALSEIGCTVEITLDKQLDGYCSRLYIKMPYIMSTRQLNTECAAAFKNAGR